MKIYDFIIAASNAVIKFLQSKTFSYLTKAIFYIYLAITTLSSCRSVLHATNFDYDGSLGKPVSTDYVSKSLNQIGYNSPVSHCDSVYIFHECPRDSICCRKY